MRQVNARVARTIIIKTRQNKYKIFYDFSIVLISVIRMSKKFREKFQRRTRKKESRGR